MASENLPPQIISRVMAEIRELVKKPADGIEYYDPSNEDDEDDEKGTVNDVPSSSSSGSEHITCSHSSGVTASSTRAITITSYK